MRMRVLLRRYQKYAFMKEMLAGYKISMKEWVT